LRSGISDNLLIDTFVQNSKFFCPEIGDLIYISSKLSANNIPIDFILSFMTYFVFLWFCPAHGHCYGFHVIVGSDGRKDPANSLYAYQILYITGFIANKKGEKFPCFLQPWIYLD